MHLYLFIHVQQCARVFVRESFNSNINPKASPCDCCHVALFLTAFASQINFSCHVNISTNIFFNVPH